MKILELLKRIFTKEKEEDVASQKNDIELQISGSILEPDLKEQEEISENNMSFDSKELSNQQIDKILNDLFDTKLFEKGLETLADTPTYVLDAKEDYIWLYSLTKNSFFKVSNRSQIISIDKITEDISHCLINNDLYEVKNDMLICIGWN